MAYNKCGTKFEKIGEGGGNRYLLQADYTHCRVHTD